MIVFHVLDDAELELPLRPAHPSSRTWKAAAPWSRIRRASAADTWRGMQTFVEGIRDACFSRKISYNLTNTQQPYDVLLAAYLDKRSRLG